MGAGSELGMKRNDQLATEVFIVIYLEKQGWQRGKVAETRIVVEGDSRKSREDWKISIVIRR